MLLIGANLCQHTVFVTVGLIHNFVPDNMNEYQLTRTRLKLHWERQYQLEDAGKESVNAFLPAIDQLDVDFRQYIQASDTRVFKVLDIGTGSGEQAFEMAKMGLNVTAIDISKTAIDHAIENFGSGNLILHFSAMDFLEMPLEPSFDIVFDRGCFTLLPASLKEAYIGQLKSVLKAEGVFCLKTDFTKGKEIFQKALDDEFVSEQLRESIYEANELAGVRKAYFSTWRKKHSKFKERNIK